MLHFGSHRCGGSIVKPNKIVTAAHCIRSTILRFISIRAGSSFHADGGIEVTVSRTIEHDFYNIPIPRTNDIGLLFLINPLVYGSGIQPIRLPEQDVETEVGVDAAVSGWGVTDEGDIAVHLQMVLVPIVDRNVCAIA